MLRLARRDPAVLMLAQHRAGRVVGNAGWDFANYGFLASTPCSRWRVQWCCGNGEAQPPQ